MTTKTLQAFLLKASLIISGITFGLSGFNNCNSQSIVGKWNQISAKQFLTAEGAKTHGKSVLETQMAAIGTVVFEFKSNFTYVEKTSHTNDSKILTFTGTWSLSGNQLELKMDPKQEDPKYNPKKDAISPDITLSINAKTMLWTTLYPDGKIISKIELTLQRM